MPVITIAQQKGGAGKTTLVAQLAAALASGGARVALLDIDPQKSLSAWHARRKDRIAAAAAGHDLGIDLEESAGPTTSPHADFGASSSADVSRGRGLLHTAPAGHTLRDGAHGDQSGAFRRASARLRFSAS